MSNEEQTDAHEAARDDTDSLRAVTIEDDFERQSELALKNGRRTTLAVVTVIAIGLGLGASQ